jgi:hypothetical protein
LDDTDAQQQPVWSELEQIARPARERRRLPPEVRSQIIIDLCRRAPLSVRDLSVLLDRSEAYVGDAIRPLVTSGDLTFLYPDQPRHPRQKYIGAREGEAARARASELSMPEPAFRGTPAPVRPREPDPDEDLVGAQDAPPRMPNAATNLIYVALVGLILGLMGIGWWWVLGLAAALSLSWWHVTTNSGQYRQFSSLRFFGSKPVSFLVLKSLVAFVEIAIVYLIVRAIAGPE